MFRILGQYEALSPGADLWALSGCEGALFFKKLNWSLKFLLAPPGAAPPQSLLAPANERFACQNILCLSRRADGKSLRENPRRCHKIWERLARPSLRVFLLKSDVEAFQEGWPEKNPHFLIEMAPLDKGSCRIAL